MNFFETRNEKHLQVLQIMLVLSVKFVNILRLIQCSYLRQSIESNVNSNRFWESSWVIFSQLRLIQLVTPKMSYTRCWTSRFESFTARRSLRHLRYSISNFEAAEVWNGVPAPHRLYSALLRKNTVSTFKLCQISSEKNIYFWRAI